jgi:hypothetical protein
MLVIPYFLKLKLHNFSTIKSHKEVRKLLESSFFLLFYLCLMIELARSGVGSVPRTNGSGSVSSGPKTIRILRTRIRHNDLSNAECSFWNFHFFIINTEPTSIILQGPTTNETNLQFFLPRLRTNTDDGSSPTTILGVCVPASGKPAHPF